MYASRLVVVVALSLALASSVRAEIDSHLPADTQLYLSINLRSTFDSEIFKTQWKDSARDLLKQMEGSEETLKELGIDPFKHLDRVVFATPKSDDADRGLIIVSGTFDAAKFKARADRLKKADDDSMKLHEVPLGGGAKQAVYEMPIPGQKVSIFLTVQDAKTLLVSPGKDYVVDAIKAARDKKKVVLKNKELQALIERLNPKQAVSIALPGKALDGLAGFDGLPRGAGDALKGIEAIGGGITIGKELTLDLAITAKSEDNAKNLRGMLEKGSRLALAGLALLGDDRKELNLLLEVVKSIKVIGKGKVVGVSARVTADTLQDLFGKGGR